MLLNAGNATLVEIIRAEIRASGPMSFARFMEQALYHPEHGYYCSGRSVIGRHGDYFTNVSVGATFAQLLALQFAEIWNAMDRTHDFILVEQGAHDGQFARDLLQAMRDDAPDLCASLRYQIVEPCASLHNHQRENLAEFHDKVSWFQSIEALAPFEGIHFSNELLDALPVHLISSQDESPWKERCVVIVNDEFALTEQPIADAALRAHVAKLPVRSGDYATEASLAAPRWIRDLSRKLIRGFVIAVDYGFPRHRFYEEDRITGTIQVRAQHHLLPSPFVRVGLSDITTHVEWTSLVEEAEASGFLLGGLTDQHHFLTGILSGSPEFMEKASAKTRRELQTLLHPEMLGRSFQVLALSKEIDRSTPLSGFKFAKDPRSEVGLAALDKVKDASAE